jgi:hypothetical protein
VVPNKALRFSGVVHKLGINPCVDLPHRVVGELLTASGKEAGPIRVRVRVNGKSFTTTVVRFSGKWRLYLNTAMRTAAAANVGDRVTVEIEFDRAPRIVPMPPRFAAALAKDPKAQAAFEDITPSHRKDILNYLNSLKTVESLERNIKKAIAESLAGRNARRSRAE